MEVVEEQFLDKKAITLLGLIVFLFLAILIVSPGSTLDGKLHYSGAEGRELFQALSASDRISYFWTEILDLFFILSYTSLFLVLFLKLFPRNLFFLYLAILPGLCDAIETSVIIYALKNQEPLYAFDWLGIMTFMKWILGLTVAALLIFLCHRRMQKIAKA